MSTSCLIIGQSGTGKSTSIRNLNPKETFLIKVLDKPMPFRKAKEMFSNGKGGNMQVTDKADDILKLFENISEKAPHIKAVIVDDFQYMMAFEFMRRAKEKGWDKFTDIAESAWRVMWSACTFRNDLVIFFLSHSEENEAGQTKAKTIGKLLDEKITVEGLFTIVLQSVVHDGQYKFLTRNNGMNTVKAPMEMFSQEYIENDLANVLKAIQEY